MKQRPPLGIIGLEQLCLSATLIFFATGPHYVDVGSMRAVTSDPVVKFITHT